MAELQLFARLNPDYLHMVETAIDDYSREWDDSDAIRRDQIEDNLNVLLSDPAIEISSDGKRWHILT